jgi:hypothetical protein
MSSEEIAIYEVATPSEIFKISQEHRDLLNQELDELAGLLKGLIKGLRPGVGSAGRPSRKKTSKRKHVKNS